MQTSAKCKVKGKNQQLPASYFGIASPTVHLVETAQILADNLLIVRKGNTKE